MPDDPPAAGAGVRADVVEAFQRVYRELRREIAGLDEAALAWRPAPDTTPIANLVMHVVGATRAHLSALAGGPHERDREAEFRAAPATAAELGALLADAERELDRYCDGLSVEDLLALRRRPPAGRPAGGLAILLQGYGHAEEHLAQLRLTKQLYRLAHAGPPCI
jgi:DinB family protein